MVKYIIVFPKQKKMAQFIAVTDSNRWFFPREVSGMSQSANPGNIGSWLFMLIEAYAIKCHCLLIQMTMYFTVNSFCRDLTVCKVIQTNFAAGTTFGNQVHFMKMHVRLKTNINLRHPCNYSFADSYCFENKNENY